MRALILATFRQIRQAPCGLIGRLLLLSARRLEAHPFLMLRQTIFYFPPRCFGPDKHVKHRPNNRIGDSRRALAAVVKIVIDMEALQGGVPISSVPMRQALEEINH